MEQGHVPSVWARDVKEIVAAWPVSNKMFFFAQLWNYRQLSVISKLINRVLWLLFQVGNFCKNVDWRSVFHGISAAVKFLCISNTWAKVILNLFLKFILRSFSFICLFLNDKAKRYISLSDLLIPIFWTYVGRDAVHGLEALQQARQEQVKAIH